ncbi:glucose PTS transporter subunit IIA [Microbacterium aurantiacum]|uniref:Glucose PTS transporter subunit IIA n=1 Tax=Microbacterium aurantiacum TaxID=162393 RepID=A0AAJ2HJR6_9MICO|nr:glucose PTS transporter subunit IIA [Microbacterium aurantiacum]MDS0245313.1 glucose PTS transporter subunit IIA [Microbacterium aurantiacum]
MEQVASARSQVSRSQVSRRRGNPLVRGIRILVDIFTPLLPVFVAGGLLTALNNLLASPGVFSENSLVQMAPWLTGFAALAGLLGAAVFALLPVLLGFSAAGRFGGSPYLGAAIGAALVAAPLIERADASSGVRVDDAGSWQIWGMDVLGIDYLGTVVPIIAIASLLAIIERLLRRKIRGAAAFLFTPMLVLLLSGMLAFLVVGPLMRFVGDALAHGVQWLYESTGAVGGMLFGGVYSPLVASGLHQGLVPVELGLMADGGSFIFPIAAAANVAQAGACLAVAVAASRGSRLRALAVGSSAPAALGIAEPAIFGVNLRLRFPFVVAAAATAIAGGFVALLDVTAVTLGAAGILGFLSISPRSITSFLICVLIAAVLSFAGTFAWARWRIARGRPLEKPLEGTGPAAASSAPRIVEVVAPVEGATVPLSSLSDPVFASSGLGPSVAISPGKDLIRSPLDGTVTAVASTGHAFGVTSPEGVEVLVHIGIDTVTLGGLHFSPMIRQGDTVSAGDTLGTVDRAAVVAAELDPVTIVIVTNADSFPVLWLSAGADFRLGDPLARVSIDGAPPGGDG